MGNYATLWITKDKNQKNIENDIFDEIKYSIPLFWITLFDVSDIKKIQDEYDETFYIFETYTEQACKIFNDRIKIWAALYDNEKVEILARAFIKYIEQFPNHFIILDVSDILSMYMDYQSEDAKYEMEDMVNTFNMLNIDPHMQIPFKHWIPSKFELSSTQTRYLELDGFGEDILSCPEIDDLLHEKEKNRSENEVQPDYELVFELNEEDFYRLLITKGEVFSGNLRDYQHRYIFLSKLKNHTIRKWILYAYLFGEFLFYFSFWFILTLTGVILFFGSENRSILWLGLILICIIAATFYTWKKMYRRINYFRNLKPYI